MLRLENLTLRYGKQVVIRALNLEVAPGKIHGLVGLNGSGKTTLINSLYGLKLPDKGTISYQASPLSKQDVACLETHNFFYANITGQEYLSLFQSRHPAFNIGGWNQLFELPLDRYIEHYSTGMKKKLAFMGILALDRPILILDEPFNGIDIETVQKLKVIMQALRDKGKTIILTAHILDALTSLCDSISYLADQQIQQTFERSEFSGMEEKLFARFNAKNQSLIDKLIE